MIPKAALSAGALVVGAATLLSACMTVPAGPSVMVLPGSGKAFEHFQADDASCRQWASQQLGTSPARAGTGSAVAGAAIGTVVGAAAGAALGAAAGNAGLGAAAGAGVGLLGGTSVGAGYAETSSYAVQRRYDNAYMQCMYARGNQIPVRRGSVVGYSARPSYPVPPASSAPAPPAGAPTAIPAPPPGPPPPPPPPPPPR